MMLPLCRASAILRRINTFLDDAEAAADAGEWLAVAEMARAVLAMDPDNEDAPALLRAAEANLGPPTTATLNPPTAHAPSQRYYPMLGFGNFESASRFCTAFDELRQYFRVRDRIAANVPLAEQRRLFIARRRSLIAETAAT